MLKIEDLRVNYGGINAVKGISLDVPENEIVTIIGANGAGKSTTLRTVAGVVKPTSGKILFDEEDITGHSPDSIVAKGITLVPEGRRVFPDLSVLENMLVLGAFHFLFQKANFYLRLARRHNIFIMLFLISHNTSVSQNLCFGNSKLH